MGEASLLIDDQTLTSFYLDVAPLIKEFVSNYQLKPVVIADDIKAFGMEAVWDVLRFFKELPTPDNFRRFFREQLTRKIITELRRFRTKRRDVRKLVYPAATQVKLQDCDSLWDMLTLPRKGSKNTVSELAEFRELLELVETRLAGDRRACLILRSFLSPIGSSLNDIADHLSRKTGEKVTRRQVRWCLESTVKPAIKEVFGPYVSAKWFRGLKKRNGRRAAGATTPSKG